MKYQAISCTTEVDQSGNQVTDLTGLIAQDLDVLMNFEPEHLIAKAKTWLNDNVLMVELESDLDLTEFYAVPAFMVLGQNGSITTKARIFSIGLIKDPAELNITKLQAILDGDINYEILS